MLSIEMSSGEKFRSGLRESRNSDGGWGYFPGKDSWLEPSAWAILALGAEADARSLDFILQLQTKDGSFRPAPNVAESTWVTALALRVLLASPERAAQNEKAIARAAEALLHQEGAEGNWKSRIFSLLRRSPVESDTRFRGWPWRDGNHSWVEPTVHSMLALQSILALPAKQRESLAPEVAVRYRLQMAQQMLLDRRSPDGGWNYGNKRVLNEDMPSYGETTGIGLLGATAFTPEQKQPGIARAQAHLSASPSRFAAAWLRLGLQAHKVATVAPAHQEPHASRDVILTALELLVLESA
jgi:hypothetical protein